MGKAIPISICRLETPFGWVTAISSMQGLKRLTFPSTSDVDALKGIRVDETVAPEDPSAFWGLREWLDAYFQGLRNPYTGPLDLEGATPFQQRVWQAIRSIPYGEIRSYGWAARELGSPRATRAVGQALATNPVCIVIPCHRVIGSDGALHGYRGGLDLKASLLALEMGRPRVTQP